jgi:hypothetical protein
MASLGQGTTTAPCSWAARIIKRNERNFTYILKKYRLISKNINIGPRK